MSVSDETHRKKKISDCLSGEAMDMEVDGAPPTPSDFLVPKKLKQEQAAKSWAKKIQVEWKILEQNLPETIYVRVYESRMELLRAVIVGPACTPYHDGLFVFDVVFPACYPTYPPMVHYHSSGFRLKCKVIRTTNCGPLQDQGKK